MRERSNRSTPRRIRRNDQRVLDPVQYASMTASARTCVRSDRPIVGDSALLIVAAAIARFACLGDGPVAIIPADALRAPSNSAWVADFPQSRLSLPAAMGRSLPIAAHLSVIAPRGL